MQLRLPLWYIFLLLCTFHIKGRAAPVCTNKKQARDDDDSDDDSDDDDDGSDHHRVSCSTGTAQHGVSKGAVAGIIIGILILLLFLILLAWWCARRRKKSRQPIALGSVGTVSTPPMRERTPPQTLRNHPSGLRPSSLVAASPVDTHPVGAVFSNDTCQRDPHRELTSIPLTRAAESYELHEPLTLPNPYEHDTPPTPPPHDDVVLPPTSPISPASTSRMTSLYTSTSSTSNSHSHTRSYSAVPSAWTHDDSTTPLLSRGATQASRDSSASSTLHEELAGYQKALEAHHHKEEEAAQQREQRIGEGSAVPEDPPPVYRDREEQ
ncbi:hypothetical protein C8Q79DRAFT_1010349 [Trametes meyenii]|nr:hypothetical protein C8Q79DRAFT_1010349 [Trametes meyenii]